MGRLFNDEFTSYNLGYRGLLVDCITYCIFRVYIMIKKGDCILIKPKDKWLCIKYYDMQDEYIRYVPMHIDMLHKRHIRKMKYDPNKVRDIHQGKGEKKIKGVKEIEFNN